MCIVFDKAEAARCLLKPIQTHDKTLDLAALGEEFVNLLFCGVERQVPDIECGRVLERVLLSLVAVLLIVVLIVSPLLLEPFVSQTLSAIIRLTCLGREVRTRLVESLDRCKGRVSRWHNDNDGVSLGVSSL